MLSPEQRATLLGIARQSIEAVLEGRRPQVEVSALDAELRRPSGAFVTLNERGGELRGCIGSIEAVVPLAQAVASSAVNAAL